MNEDDIIYWQDTLEAVGAGRTGGLKCPFCYEGEVLVTQRERVTRVECAKCHHFVEGRFPDSDQSSQG